MISGQNLPKPGGAKEIIDPYVKVQFFGAHEDRKVFKTKVVDDNGERGVGWGVERPRGWGGGSRL